MSNGKYNRQRAKFWRDYCIRENLCMRCRVKPATHGRKCKSCRDSWLLPARLFHMKYNGVSAKEVQKAKRAWAKFNQTCQACGKRRCCGDNWTFDHDHKTKKFRGIVGRHCNSVLGFMKDDIESLKSMIRYLRRAGRL